jgi:hypothetical protein
MSLLLELSEEQQKSLTFTGPTYPVNIKENMLLLLLDSLLIFLFLLFYYPTYSFFIFYGVLGFWGDRKSVV